MNHKETVRTVFENLWTNPELARAACTDDVTWVTTRSMPIPGNEGSIEHVGWEAFKNVADSGKDSDTGSIPETLDYVHQRYFEAEDDHVIYQFTMKCTTKLGRSYINDYLFLVKLRDGKVCRMQEYWDSKQAFDLLYG